MNQGAPSRDTVTSHGHPLCAGTKKSALPKWFSTVTLQVGVSALIVQTGNTARGVTQLGQVGSEFEPLPLLFAGCCSFHLMRLHFLWPICRSHMQEVSFQAFPSTALTWHTLGNTVKVGLSHRGPLPGENAAAEVQARRDEVKLHAAWEGAQLRSPKYHTLSCGVCAYIKSHHIYSVHCLNELYNATKGRQFKADFLIGLYCGVSWIVRSLVCFAKVSACVDLLGKNVHFNEALW